MKYILFILFSFALCFPTATRAAQVVMDFDHLAAPAALNTIISPHIEDGLRLTNSSNFYLFGPGSSGFNGRKGLAIQFTGSVNTLNTTSGSPFTLVSMRLSPNSANTNATVTFTGHVAGGGTVTTTLTSGTSLAGIVRTFPANFTNLTSVTWTMDSSGTQYHQVDDITANLRPEITVSPAMIVTESAGTVTVGLTLSEALTAPLSMQWNATNGTALAVSDYASNGQVGSTFTIPAGQRSKTFTIDLVDDTLVEPIETFSVAFTTTSSAVAYTNGNTATTVRIASDDGLNGFPDWVSAHGLTSTAAAPNADPNGDGVSNLESWLCKINPAGPSPQTVMDRRATFLFDGASRPALRFSVPSPFPSDVQMIFEETAVLSSWSEQARRTGWGLGSLWTGTGSTRVVETGTSRSKTVTCSGSQTRNQRSRAFLRMKLNYISGGGSS